ncbi:MAG: FAD-dependent oxidoreductase, partial [Clostridiales bacterium]|nr:FAD-dependent oxidoreductase [Clostridiales bacterium]
MFVSPCENTCPANVNVPGYNALVEKGRFIDAYNLIRQENPFPAICGRICTRPCEAKCRRASLDEAVAICDIKRFVADYARSHEQPTADIIFPRNGKRVAVIGGGPGGLSCAWYLARIGYEVNVYESEKLAGGVLAYGIPEYRLPQETLQYEIQKVEREGVKIHLNTVVGKDISFDEIRKTNDAVFIAVGTQVPQRVGCEGEDMEGVIGGLDFLKDVKLNGNRKIGQRVAVIGGGNTAIDSARTALRLGAKEVTIVYRRTRGAMPADEIEIHHALEEGVQIMELTQPLRFVGRDNKVEQMI